MNYTKGTELIFKYIVKDFIDSKMTKNEIIELLISSKLCSKTITNQFDKLAYEILKTTWTSQGYFVTESKFNLDNVSNLENNNSAKLNENSSETLKNTSLSMEAFKSMLRSNFHSLKIDKLELAYTVQDKAGDIQVSPNDALTLLKNMALIQSKINEIAKAINKIAKAFDSISKTK